MDSSTFFGISSIMYILAMVLYISYLVFKKDVVGWIATIFTAVGFSAHTASFILRWYEFSQIGGMGLLRAAPLTNLYESIVFFVWCLILGYLLVEWRYKNRSLGAFITPIAGMALAFIDISGMSKEIHPLVPALQSNWLLAHVTMSFIAYAAFAISFATALMYLSTVSETRRSPSYIIWTTVLGIFIVVLLSMGLDFMVFKVAGMSQKVFLKGYLFKSTFRSDSTFVVLMS
ncbi:MAG: cytochrome c biogenesis protein CcsA, partial [Thermodesulfovibrionales bacterium]